MKTRNNLKLNAKKVSMEILNARLADGIDLALVTKQAHWNIKGPNFIAVTKCSTASARNSTRNVDTMAERVAQLGGTALGTSQTVAAATKLAPYPTNIHASKDHLGALAERYGTAADLAPT